MQRIKIILNYGTLAGISAYAMFLIYFYVFGLNPFGAYFNRDPYTKLISYLPAIKLLSIWVPVVFLYLGLKKHRDVELEGFATYGQLFITSTTFTFIFSSLSAMLIFLHCTVDTSVVAQYVIDSPRDLGEIKDFIVQLIGRDQYQLLVDEVQKTDGARLAVLDFFNKTVGTFVIALVVCAILKKQPPIFEVRND